MPTAQQTSNAAYHRGQMLEFLNAQSKKAGTTKKDAVIAAPFTDDSVTKLAAFWVKIYLDLNGNETFNAIKVSLKEGGKPVAPPSNYTWDQQLTKVLDQDFKNALSNGGNQDISLAATQVQTAVLNLLKAYRQRYSSQPNKAKTFDITLERAINQVGIDLGILAPPGSDQHI